MLIAQDVAFDDHYFRLIDPTDFSAPAGSISLLQSSTSLGRAALALIASGRMKPSAGTVHFLEDLGEDDDVALEPDSPSSLRRRTAVVDSPGISAPEHHMTVRQVVSESLALRPVFTGLPGEPRRRRWKSPMRAMEWLERHSMAELARRKVAALDAEARLWLLIELAFADTAVHCAVIDSPDRHRINGDRLVQVLQECVEADPARSVLAVVQHVPEGAELTIGGEISFANEADGAIEVTTAEESGAEESEQPMQSERSEYEGSQYEQAEYESREYEPDEYEPAPAGESVDEQTAEHSEDLSALDRMMRGRVMRHRAGEDEQ